MYLSSKTERRSNLTEWLFLSIVLLALGAGFVIWYSVERARVNTAENERLNDLSKILVKEISVNLVAVNNALTGILRDRLNDSVPADPVAVTKRLRALVEAMPGVRSIFVLDENATVIAALPSDLVGRNFRGRTYFSVPKQRGDAGMLYLSPPFRSIRGDTVMTATRIVSGAGQFRGVVTATLDPSYFSDILKTALYAADLRATIEHSAGGVFVGTGARTSTNNMAPDITARTTIIPAGLRADSAAGLTLKRPVKVVQAPLTRDAQVFSVIFAALALISCATLGWFQRRRREERRHARDREEERTHAQAVIESEARFRTLIEEAPVAVAMARQGRFIYTNRRYNLLHGYNADEDMTGVPWRAMIAPDSLARLQEQQAQIDADMAVEQRFEAIGIGNSATLIPVLKATARVTLSDGPATLIFVQDITAQKTAEISLLEARDAAQAANRSKAEFLANMSHEIRTPLNAILGMAYLLERANRDAHASPMLQKIRVAGRSLLGIVNDVLDVSKIEAGAMVIEQSWFQLQDVIDTVAATMGVAIGDKPVALLIHPVPPAAASVFGDALRLEQLLVNLTSNAIKFTESGSIALEIGLHTQADGLAELLFKVSDTGIGIAPGHQDTIFSPFTQADTSTTRRYGGSGLGLTICKQIVELMGGRIGVRSEVGSGSTFWFSLTLPVRPEPGRVSSPEMVDLDVLVAASGEQAGMALTDTARALGWRARHVDSGAAVLADLRRPYRGTLPGVIILDWQLGGAGCLATARAIREDSATAPCPIVILVTTNQAAAFENDAARTLADALLTWPVTVSTLYNAVIEARRRHAVKDSDSDSDSDSGTDTDSDNGAGPHPAAGKALPGVRILVVDDSSINRDVARGILVDEGADVVLAENGRAAVDWLVRHPDAVDLVLMDVQMPVMDGIEATRILRGMPRFADLPIVALTAGAFSSHQDAARNAGMTHFIAKPFDIPATICLIRRITDRGGASAILPFSAGVPVQASETPGTLDVRRGLKTWRTRENYQRYLRKFAIAYADAVATMQRDLASGNVRAVAATAHKLAGAAANVALPSVSTLARRIELAPDHASEGAALLEELHIAMGAALDAIGNYAPLAAEPMAPLIAPATGAATQLAPLSTLFPLLEKMVAALEEGMPEPAIAALAELAPHVPAELLAPIASCIEDFDWLAASRLTRALGTDHHTMHSS